MVRPFKAVRPDVKYVEKVAALPYDVMNSDEAREMVKDNPYSFLHIDKAEIDLDKSIDLYDDAVYKKAKENLQKLVDDKILISDTKPCFYVYRLTMQGRSQTGLVASVPVDKYLSGCIKKHELTRKDKEQDRTRHILETNANTGPIFLTYKNKSEIDDVIEEWIESNTPIYNFTSSDKITHEAWIIDNDNVLDKIIKLFENVDTLYIADGHHRNASAVNVAQIKRGNDDYDKNAEFNYYLSVIFPDNQLHIMDYNRVVKTLNGLTVNDFLDKVSKNFVVEKIGETAYKPDKVHTFGMYLDKSWYKLTAKEEIIDITDPIAVLDVSILQEKLLSPILGIQDPRIDKNIDFVGGARGLSELSKRVDSGEMKVAFSMFPTSINELMRIADEDKIMPPKSTWFEPKLRSGLFIHYL